MVGWERIGGYSGSGYEHLQRYERASGVKDWVRVYNSGKVTRIKYDE